MFGVERYMWPVFDSCGRSLIVCLARILDQLTKHKPFVPVEIFAQAKAKEPANDAIPKFLAEYTSHSRVGTIMKETPTGKLVDEWNKVLNASASKPEMSDATPSISSVMAVKDEEELVSSLLFGVFDAEVTRS